MARTISPRSDGRLVRRAATGCAARQAEAEREKRAKIIHAEGELIASEKLSQAAAVIGREPGAMTLRYLQTLNEIAAEQNSTIVFPLPIDLITK
jgi:regulator of protease activity HflC (stomatin/prohibitin superfamily)